MIKYTFKANEAHRILSLRFGREAGADLLQITSIFDCRVRLGKAGIIQSFAMKEIFLDPEKEGVEGGYVRGNLWKGDMYPKTGWMYPKAMGLQDGAPPPAALTQGFTEIRRLTADGAPNMVGHKNLEYGLQIHGNYDTGWNLVLGNACVRKPLKDNKAVFASPCQITHDYAL